MARVLSRITDARPSGTVQSKYDVVPPVTSYAASARKTPLISQNRVAPSSNRSGSMVVARRPRRNGQQFFYSHGSVTMPTPKVPTTGAGGVQTSVFQTQNVQLMDWQKNLAWFAAGYPRNLGLSTRVDQLKTKSSGGPGNSTMDARPLFPKVQQVPRYNVIVPTYQTRSANG